MKPAADIAAQPVRRSAPGNARIRQQLVTLAVAFVVGLVAVWQLRESWAWDTPWPWLPLVAAAVGGAIALRRLALWLPGQPIPPRLAAAPTRAYRALSLVCFAASAGQTALGLWWLRESGPLRAAGFWGGALLLLALGAWLTGSAGRASPRAAAALTLWPDTVRNRRLELAALLVILGVAAVLQARGLFAARPALLDSLSPDALSGAAGLDLSAALAGRGSPFAVGDDGVPNAYFAYTAAAGGLLGGGERGLHMAALLPALLTILALFMLARLLYGPGAGLAAALMLAVNPWYLGASRQGWAYTGPPLLAALALCFLSRGLRDRRGLDYALGGILAGLGLYAGVGGPLAAATLLLAVLIWLLAEPGGMVPALRRSWPGLILTLAGLAVAAAPMLVTAVAAPRPAGAATVTLWSESRDVGSLEPVARELASLAQFFQPAGDLALAHGVAGDPLLDPLTAALFAVGLAYAVLARRDHRYGLLIVWLVVGVVGALLAPRDPAPLPYRALFMLPAVLLLAADMLDRAARAICGLLQERPRAAARQAFPVQAALGAAALALIVSVVSSGGGAALVPPPAVPAAEPAPTAALGVVDETAAALRAGQAVYVASALAERAGLRFPEGGGGRPLYRALIPEVGLPLADTGRDALLLLDAGLWPLQAYFASYYPGARMELVQPEGGSPPYMRVAIERDAIAALQGLTERVGTADGQRQERAVPTVALPTGELPDGALVEWAGALRVERAGDYELRGEGNVRIFLDDTPVDGLLYLSRGLYALRVERPADAEGEPRILWRTPGANLAPVPGEALAPVPPTALFRLDPRRQGLFATYYRGMDWEEPAVHRQVVPFVWFDWPDERPVMPDGSFSARFAGALRVAEAGTYRLRVEADDGARLTVDGVVVGEDLATGRPTSFEGTVELEPGEHAISIDYLQHGGDTSLRLLWGREGGPLTPVPPSALVPARP